MELFFKGYNLGTKINRKINKDYGVTFWGRDAINNTIKDIFSTKYPNLTAQQIFNEEMKLHIEDLIKHGCKSHSDLLNHLSGFVCTNVLRDNYE